MSGNIIWPGNLVKKLPRVQQKKKDRPKKGDRSLLDLVKSNSRARGQARSFLEFHPLDTPDGINQWLAKLKEVAATNSIWSSSITCSAPDSWKDSVNKRETALMTEMYNHFHNGVYTQMSSTTCRSGGSVGLFSPVIRPGKQTYAHIEGTGHCRQDVLIVDGTDVLFTYISPDGYPFDARIFIGLLTHTMLDEGMKVVIVLTNWIYFYLKRAKKHRESSARTMNSHIINELKEMKLLWVLNYREIPPTTNSLELAYNRIIYYDEVKSYDWRDWVTVSPQLKSLTDVVDMLVLTSHIRGRLLTNDTFMLMSAWYLPPNHLVRLLLELCLLTRSILPFGIQRDSPRNLVGVSFFEPLYSTGLISTTNVTRTNTGSTPWSTSQSQDEDLVSSNPWNSSGGSNKTQNERWSSEVSANELNKNKHIDQTLADPPEESIAFSDGEQERILNQVLENKNFRCVEDSTSS